MILEEYVGFDWDDGNLEKCASHGVRRKDVESLFRRGVDIRPDLAHSAAEERFHARGRVPTGRPVFIVFTIRRRDEGAYIRPISARYMHRREVIRFEKDNPHI